MIISGLTAIIVMVIVPTCAIATNGYFMIDYGAGARWLGWRFACARRDS